MPPFSFITKFLQNYIILGTQDIHCCNDCRFSYPKNYLASTECCKLFFKQISLYCLGYTPPPEQFNGRKFANSQSPSHAPLLNVPPFTILQETDSINMAVMNDIDFSMARATSSPESEGQRTGIYRFIITHYLISLLLFKCSCISCNVSAVGGVVMYSGLGQKQLFCIFEQAMKTLLQEGFKNKCDELLQQTQPITL